MAARSIAACFMLGLLGLVEIAHGFSLPLVNYEAHYLAHHARDSFSDRLARLPPRGPASATSDCDTVAAVPDAVRKEMKLDLFYQKYTHAYGIPIISSNNPPDSALRRACYVVRFLMADRKDIRDELHDAHGRIGVIGWTEQTTDIPEHSYLSDYWNTRARGLGGTRHNPISTDAEENMLCYGKSYDPWYEEDILVHEFSHGIHLIAIKYVDPSWQTRLEMAYNNAKSKNLWANTYAITNSEEYFSEGVQSYFDVEVHRTYVDGIHNDISTRKALLGYDPELYGLLREIFPCQNKIVDRCDDQSETSTKYMAMDCPFFKN